MPYPARIATPAGRTHQIDLVGPRHLLSGVEFHAPNLIDIGSHEVASEILEVVRPPRVAASMAMMWSTVGVPEIAQFDNHAIVEHFNDVWDKSFFRTEVFTSLSHLRGENDAFIVCGWSRRRLNKTGTRSGVGRHTARQDARGA